MNLLEIKISDGLLLGDEVIVRSICSSPDSTFGTSLYSRYLLVEVSIESTRLLLTLAWFWILDLVEIGRDDHIRVFRE